MGGKKWVPSYADVLVKDHSTIKLGDLRLKAIHTPGHTPEHLVWLCYDESRSSKVPWFAFTGDCLFVGSIGRPDLLGEEELPHLASQLYHTIFDVLEPLPDFLEILPGHGAGSMCGKALKQRPTSTLGFEKLFNPYLKKEPIGKWVEQIVNECMVIPPYFRKVKKMNLEGPPLLNSLRTELWNQKKKTPSLKKLFIFDVRHPEIFAAGHIKDALNIPLSHTFCHWAGWMLPSEQPLGLVVENTHVYSEVVDQLRLIGFDQDIWVILWGESNQQIPCSLSNFPVIEPEEIAKQHAKNDSLCVLDVRSDEEWCSGHIPWAMHVECSILQNSLDHVPKDKTIALICRSGQRASLAASLLQKSGFSSIVNIRGGDASMAASRLASDKEQKKSLIQGG